MVTGSRIFILRLMTDLCDGITTELPGLREEKIMECPYLAGRNIWFYCIAVHETYEPDSARLNEYCKQSRHALCSFYVNAQERLMLKMSGKR